MRHGSVVTGCLIKSLPCSPFSGRSFLPSLQQPSRGGHLLQGQRITVHCDSIAIVQAWSNQSARHPGILHLLRTLFFITTKHGFIVRLVHLQTEPHCRCSLPPPVITVLCPCPTGQLTANPSTSSAGRALSRQMEKLISRVLAPSTFNMYQTCIRRYYNFCSIHQQKSLPGTARTLAQFVTDVSMNLQLGLFRCTYQQYLTYTI